MASRDNYSLQSTRHSKSNPIELNFNRTQSNSIGGLSSIEFGNRTKSNSPKRKKSIEPNRTFIEFTHRGTTGGTRKFSQLSFFPQEQCFVIFKRYTLKSAGQDNS